VSGDWKAPLWAAQLVVEFQRRAGLPMSHEAEELLGELLVSVRQGGGAFTPLTDAEILFRIGMRPGDRVCRCSDRERVGIVRLVRPNEGWTPCSGSKGFVDVVWPDGSESGGSVEVYERVQP
jgi:hypothetical protein